MPASLSRHTDGPNTVPYPRQGLTAPREFTFKGEPLSLGSAVQIAGWHPSFAREECYFLYVALSGRVNVTPTASLWL